MDVEAPRKPWYKRTKYVLLIGLLVALIILSLVSPLVPTPPKSSNLSRLDRTIGYFAHNYDFTVGLIPESPGSSTYWLYSDNYLASLAVSRYSSSNQTTTSFAAALSAVLEGYAVTFPPGLDHNQYTALNSTSAAFACSNNYELSWAANGQTAQGAGSVAIWTTVNNGNESCSSQNYADLIILHALLLHRLGNATGASNEFALATVDFDGNGFRDAAFGGTQYQTYKLALYIYASNCLGQAVDGTYSSAVSTLLHLQDNSTGGFYTGYTSSRSPAGTSVNTETTALAALALEQLIKPSTSC